jgi:hypothetical protein
MCVLLTHSYCRCSCRVAVCKFVFEVRVVKKRRDDAVKACQSRLGVPSFQVQSRPFLLSLLECSKDTADKLRNNTVTSTPRTLNGEGVQPCLVQH